MHDNARAPSRPRLTAYAYWLLVSRIGVPIITAAAALDLLLS